MVKVTVFVPTYNRAKYLEKIVESLEKQYFNDFELLIIDDGSTDSTRALVESYIEPSSFKIRYFFQTNSGKHIAYNYAIQEACGELFLELDSDDYLVPKALQTIVCEWESIDNKDEYAGMQCLCIDQNGKLIGTKFERNTTDNYELRFIDKVKGDKGMIYLTSKLKNYSLPEIKNEIVQESILHNRISQKYKTKCIHEPLIVKQYLQGGLTQQDKTIFTTINSRIIYFNELNHFKVSVERYFYINSRFVKFSLLNGDTFGSIYVKAINKRPYFMLAYFFGFISYLKYKNKNRGKQGGEQ